MNDQTIHLISEDDVGGYQQALINYVEFLVERIPDYYEEVVLATEDQNEAICFGSILFQVINHEE